MDAKTGEATLDFGKDCDLTVEADRNWVEIASIFNPSALGNAAMKVSIAIFR